MKSYGVCADCGAGLTGDSGLCFPCKQRLIKEVNSPAVDKAISLIMWTVILGFAVWLIF